MKNLIKSLVLSLAIVAGACSKDDDNAPSGVNNPDVPTTADVKVSNRGFNFKQYYQEIESPENRKGIVILAHGDGTDENDDTLNSQCEALATYGYVGVTMSYQSSDFGTPDEINARFKGDMEDVIAQVTTEFGIDRSKVIIGGLSRGGNNAFQLVLPGQVGITPIAGIKGVILECSGGDEWKGSAILYPVAYMANKVDPEMNSNANDFKAGLENNQNNGVASMSDCLIINSSGHCTSSGQYESFVVEKVREWLD